MIRGPVSDLDAPSEDARVWREDNCVEGSTGSFDAFDGLIGFEDDSEDELEDECRTCEDAAVAAAVAVFHFRPLSLWNDGGKEK